MTQCITIIRAAIPNCSDAQADYVLWSRTPFPIGRVSARSLYKAASGLYRASKRGISLCDFCHKPAINNDLCADCHSSFSAALKEQP